MSSNLNGHSEMTFNIRLVHEIEKTIQCYGHIKHKISVFHAAIFCKPQNYFPAQLFRSLSRLL